MTVRDEILKVLERLRPGPSFTDYGVDAITKIIERERKAAVEKYMNTFTPEELDARMKRKETIRPNLRLQRG